MQEKVVMVTGATNGIGKIAAIELAKMGARVIVVGRNASKCKDTVEEVQAQAGHQGCESMLADLSSMKEVRALANTFLEKYNRLDVLLNNAGGMFYERQESVDGWEMTFALNHFNYFLLTNLLLDVLKKTADERGEARIVNVSSGAHQGARKGIPFDDFQMKQKYSSFPRYAQSKLANLLFTFELATQLEGTNVTVNALHPGFVATGFGHQASGFMTSMVKLSQKFFAMSPEKGAETLIYLASSPEVKGHSGQYYYKKKVAKTTRHARDKEMQKRLWKLSEELTGLG